MKDHMEIHKLEKINKREAREIEIEVLKNKLQHLMRKNGKILKPYRY